MSRRQGWVYTCLVLTIALGLALTLGHGCSTLQPSRHVDRSVPTEHAPPPSRAETERQTEPETPSAEFETSPIDSQAMVEVVDEWTARVIPGVVLSWEHNESGGSVTTSLDGTASVPSLALQAGLRAEHVGYYPLSVADAAPSGRLVAGKYRIELTPKRTGRGVVVNAHGSPVAGARVLLRAEVAHARQIPASGGLCETVTDAEGRFEFPVSSRSRSLFATTSDGDIARTRIGKGQDSVRVVVRPGAALEVMVEGDGLSKVSSLELRQQQTGPEVTGLQLYSAPVNDGLAVFRGLGPQEVLELTCPQLPGVVWSVRLEGPGSVTRILIVIGNGVLKLKLNWTAPPIEPIAQVLVGLTGGDYRPVGEVVSQTEALLPPCLAPLPLSLRLRFATAEGVIVGVALRRDIRLMADGVYECDATPVVPIRGRVVHENGAPAAGAVVQVLSSGRAVLVVPPVTAADDGSFVVSVDNRFPMHVTAGHNGRCVEREFDAHTTEFGELRLSAPRTIRVHLKGPPSGSAYYVSTHGGIGSQLWTAPLECQVGEFVDIPASESAQAVIVAGPDCEIVQPVNPGDDEIDVWVHTDGLTIKLRARVVDEAAGRDEPNAGVTFSLAEPPTWPVDQQIRPSRKHLVVTDSNGEAVVKGVAPGQVEVEYVAPRVTGWPSSAGPFQVSVEGQELPVLVRIFPKLEGYVPVVGTVRPVPEDTALRIVALDRPLPRPMTGREIKGAGIRTSAISGSSHIVGGGYGARMDPNFPHIAIMIDTEGEIFDNAGYLVKIGDIWRADLVVPPRAKDRMTARAVLSAPPGAEVESPRLKLIWSEGGAFRAQDLPATPDKELEFGWPRAAERVWLVASARSGERLLAAFIEPQAGVTNRVDLAAMPRIEVSGAQGLQGLVSLTPEGIAERRWISITDAIAGKLVAAGVGTHEFAGVDAQGVVRVSRVNVAAGTGPLALDLREVLTD